MKSLREELEFLKKAPWFEERPASVAEFLGSDYLNIAGKIRPRVLQELTTIMGDKVHPKRMTKYPLALVTGGVGSGKTSICSIVLTYMAHWVLCLKDPQDFFDLMPGSRIAFMQMSTSEKQALEVVFGDVKARVIHSAWFKKYPFNPDFKNQLRFPKNVWILPGDSKETTFEGYNILGGILDEADSHLTTDKADYAEVGYTTISSRIESRFGTSKARGFLMVVGQRKSLSGFAERKYQEFTRRPDAYAVSLTIWDSLGWDKYMNPDGTRDSFWYDKLRKRIVPTAVVSILDNKNLIEIPNNYKREFENDPVKALRDLAGMPPSVGDPFIALQHKITDARDRWLEHHPGFTSPVTPEGMVEDWFRAKEGLPRVGHLDLAYAEDGDGLGFAMGHVSEVVEIDGEKKPYIVIDLMMRLTAPAGGEIMLADARHFIYDLRDERGFKIKKVTMDGFESTDTRQQFNRRRIDAEEVSVDKKVLPYYDLREALYEDRIEFPQYMVHLRRGQPELVEIAVKELSELVDNIKKVDHPAGGTGCFVGDTRIPTLDGRDVPISELADGTLTWVYTSNDQGQFEPAVATGRRTKQVTELVDVVLDSGAVVRCTPEHPWRLRDGTYKAAEALTDADRLMPLYRKLERGYEHISLRNGQTESTHILVSEFFTGPKTDQEVVHHKSHDKRDNRPENLVKVNRSEHNRYHSATRHATDPAYATKVREALTAYWATDEAREAQRQVIAKGDIMRGQLRRWKHMHEERRELLHKVIDSKTVYAAAKRVGICRNSALAAVQAGGYEDWSDFKERAGVNHRVRFVQHIHLDEPVWVYDLEVDRNDNFALTAGVFVHNSKDVADCLAGVTYSLMGDRSYRRKVTNISDWQAAKGAKAAPGSTFTHPAFLGGNGAQMPLPPAMPQWGG